MSTLKWTEVVSQGLLLCFNATCGKMDQEWKRLCKEGPETMQLEGAIPTTGTGSWERDSHGQLFSTRIIKFGVK